MEETVNIHISEESGHRLHTGSENVPCDVQNTTPFQEMEQNGTKWKREKRQKTMSNYSCQECTFVCSRKCDYERHLTTPKHTSRFFDAKSGKKRQKSGRKSGVFCSLTYTCEDCTFICSRKCDYDRHIVTPKHKKRQKAAKSGDSSTFSEGHSLCCKNEPSDAAIVSVHQLHQPYQPSQLVDDPYTCTDCSRTFKSKSGLWKHSKKCDESESSRQSLSSRSLNRSDIQNLFETQNTLVASTLESTREIMADTLSKVADKINHVTAVVTTAVETASPKVTYTTNNTNNTNNTTNTNNTNNTNNTTFNLSLFLNDTCKDAMNITDFVNSLKNRISDLDYMGRAGYVEGVSKVIIEGLNKLEITQRPIHCTDAKRNSLYLKDNNQWNKELPNMSNIKRAIRRVANKNVQNLSNWKKSNPSHEMRDTQKHKDYLAIVNHAMGGATDKEDDNHYKGIITRLSIATVLDKNKYIS